MKFFHEVFKGNVAKKINEILPEGVQKSQKPISFLEKELSLKAELEEKADDLQFRITELKKVVVDLENKKNTNSNLVQSLESTQKELENMLGYFHQQHEDYSQVLPEFYKTVQQLQIAKKSSENLVHSKEETPEVINKNIEVAKQEIAKCEELVVQYQRLAMGISNILVDEIEAEERGGVSAHLN